MKSSTKKRILSLFLCACFCLALPLVGSALTEEQVINIANYNEQQVTSWGIVKTVYGNAALPMVDAAIYREPSPLGHYYLWSHGRLQEGCVTQMVTKVDYTVSLYKQNGAFINYTHAIITKNTGEFILYSTGTLGTKELHTDFYETGHESHQYNAGTTRMDAYIVAYMGGGFNYWTGVHIWRNNMP